MIGDTEALWQIKYGTEIGCLSRWLNADKAASKDRPDIPLNI